MPTPIQMPSRGICATSLASSVFLGGQTDSTPQLPFSAMSSLLALKAWPTPSLLLASSLFPGSLSPPSLGSCLDPRNSPNLRPGPSPELQTSLSDGLRALPSPVASVPPVLLRNVPQTPDSRIHRASLRSESDLEGNISSYTLRGFFLR